MARKSINNHLILRACSHLQAHWSLNKERHLFIFVQQSQLRYDRARVPSMTLHFSFKGALCMAADSVSHIHPGHCARRRLPRVPPPAPCATIHAALRGQPSQNSIIPSANVLPNLIFALFSVSCHRPHLTPRYHTASSHKPIQNGAYTTTNTHTRLENPS
jgi:hypothetical protein